MDPNGFMYTYVGRRIRKKKDDDHISLSVYIYIYFIGMVMPKTIKWVRAVGLQSQHHEPRAKYAS